MPDFHDSLLNFSLRIRALHFVVCGVGVQSKVYRIGKAFSIKKCKLHDLHLSHQGNGSSLVLNFYCAHFSCSFYVNTKFITCLCVSKRAFSEMGGRKKYSCQVV